MSVRLIMSALAALIVASAAVATMISTPAKISLIGSGPVDTSPIRQAERAPGQPGELDARQQIFDRVQQLLLARDYLAIDAMEQRLRTTGERSSSGIPKLHEFHAAVQRSFGNPNVHTDCMMSGEQLLDEWEKAAPNSPTVYITKAAVLMRRAWCWRGTGYASEVPQEDWPKFRDNVAAAERVLTTHMDVAIRDPEYYSVTEDIYQAAGRDRSAFDALLKQAAAADPYYYPIYWGAYFYNLPEWHGSDADLDAVARFAVKHTRAKDGLGAYARFYWYASQEGCGCWRSAIDWPSMKQAMHDVAKRYPDPWNLANFARLSCEMKDANTANDYFKALGKYDGSEAWPDDQAGWQQCRTLAGV